MGNKSSQELIEAFVFAHLERKRLRSQRDACYCERAEPVSRSDYEDAAAESRHDPMATFEFPQPTQDAACWKAARQWQDRGPDEGRMYFIPPPSEWCATCQRRQTLTEALRAIAVRRAGALRGLIARGKWTARARAEQAMESPSAQDAVHDSSK